MNRRARAVDGILLLDKPAGLSSNQALVRVRGAYGARKAGHAGSLDPFATGLLPVLLGEATKFSGALLEAAKGYRAACRLGATTTTGDPEGDVSETAPVPPLDRELVERVLAGFVGEIEQVPPMYSALKHRGRRLYQLAREGREVERKPRRVTIHELALIELGENGFEFEVVCSKGTYVRTLVEDLAAALGTLGHTVALRRTRVGPFGEGAMHTLDELERIEDPAALDRLLLGVDAGLQGLPALELDQEAARRIGHGQPVPFTGSQPGRVRLYLAGGRFLGLGEARPDGSLAPVRLVVVSGPS